VPDKNQKQQVKPFSLKTVHNKDREVYPMTTLKQFKRGSMLNKGQKKSRLKRSKLAKRGAHKS
jgi:hypothetical protein